MLARSSWSEMWLKKNVFRNGELWLVSVYGHEVEKYKTCDQWKFGNEFVDLYCTSYVYYYKKTEFSYSTFVFNPRNSIW